MNQTADKTLIEAIKTYDYPPITYDFLENYERIFSSMIDLEQFLQSLLLSGDMRSVKDGVSGILYWGHFRAPYRDVRVDTFRAAVSDTELQRAREVFRYLEGTRLTNLKGIGLPQFSNMSFVTKLRTFLDPEHYCVLDKKIADLAPLNIRLKRYPTCIPITQQNERAYEWWVNTCSLLASHLGNHLRPVDIERGIFWLVEHGKVAVAAEILDLCGSQKPLACTKGPP